MMNKSKPSHMPQLGRLRRGKEAADGLQEAERHLRSSVEQMRFPTVDTCLSLVQNEATIQTEASDIINGMVAALRDQIQLFREGKLPKDRKAPEEAVDAIYRALPGSTRRMVAEVADQVTAAALPDPAHPGNQALMQHTATADTTSPELREANAKVLLLETQKEQAEEALQRAQAEKQRADRTNELRRQDLQHRTSVGHQEYDTAKRQLAALEEERLALLQAAEVLVPNVIAAAAAATKAEERVTRSKASAEQPQQLQPMSETQLLRELEKRPEDKDCVGLLERVRTLRVEYNAAAAAKESSKVAATQLTAEVRALETERSTSTVPLLEEIAKEEVEVQRLNSKLKEARLEQAVAKSKEKDQLLQLGISSSTELPEQQIAKIRVVLDNGATEKLVFLGAKLVLRYVDLAYGTPARAEVEANMVMKQGCGPGVPADETLDAYAIRSLTGDQRARLYGLTPAINGFTEGLLHDGVKNTMQAVLHLQPDMSPGKMLKHAKQLQLQYTQAEQVRAKQKLNFSTSATGMMAAAGAARPANPAPAAAGVTDLAALVAQMETNLAKRMDRQLQQMKSQFGKPTQSVEGRGTETSSSTTAAGPSSKTDRPGRRTGRPSPCPKCGKPHEGECWPTCPKCKRTHPATSQCNIKCPKCLIWHQPDKNCWDPCSKCGWRHRRGNRCLKGTPPDQQKAAPQQAHLAAAEEHEEYADDESGWFTDPQQQQQWEMEEEQEPEYGYLALAQGYSDNSYSSTICSSSWQQAYNSSGTQYPASDQLQQQDGMVAAFEDGVTYIDCCYTLPSQTALVADRVSTRMPASFEPRRSQRQAAKQGPTAVTQRLQQAEEQQPATAKGRPGTPPAKNHDKQASSSRARQTAGTSASSTEPDYTLIVFENKPDLERLLSKLYAEAADGLTAIMVPKPMIRKLVQQGAMGVQPAVAMAVTTAEATQRAPPEVVTCSNTDVLPTLPMVPAEHVRLRAKGVKQVLKVDLCLLDTGANSGLIAEHVARQWKLPILPTNVQLTGISGAARAAGSVRDLKLELDLKEGGTVRITFDATVVSGDQNVFSIIVGRKQMHALGMVLNFYDQTCAVHPSPGQLSYIYMKCVQRPKKHVTFDSSARAAMVVELACPDPDCTEPWDAEPLLQLLEGRQTYGLVPRYRPAPPAPWLQRWEAERQTNGTHTGAGYTLQPPATPKEALSAYYPYPDTLDAWFTTMGYERLVDGAYLGLREGTAEEGQLVLEAMDCRSSRMQHHRRLLEQRIQPLHLNAAAAATKWEVLEILSKAAAWLERVPAAFGDLPLGIDLTPAESMYLWLQEAGSWSAEQEQQLLQVLVDFGWRYNLFSNENKQAIPQYPRNWHDLKLEGAARTNYLHHLALGWLPQQQRLPFLVQQQQEHGTPLLQHTSWQQTRLERSGDVEMNPGPLQEPAAHRLLYGNWQQDKLLRSGDVEQNPGPKTHTPRYASWTDFLYMVALVTAVAMATWQYLAPNPATHGWQWIGYLMTTAVVSAISRGMPTVQVYSRMNSKLEWPWQVTQKLHNKAKQGYFKYRETQRQREAAMGFGNRRQQRRRKRGMLPVILFVICLFLFVMTATHGAPIVSSITQLSRSLVGKGLTTGGAAATNTPNTEGTYTFHGGVWGTSRGTAHTAGWQQEYCLYAYTDGIHPLHVLQEFDPLNSQPNPAPHAEILVDPDGQWQFATGSSTNLTVQQQEELQQLVRDRKGSHFAYSLDELPGAVEEVEWTLKQPDKRLFIPCHARKLSPMEKAICDEKVAEMEAAKIQKEVEPRGNYAFHPVVAAKKDAFTGLYTDKRYCTDFRPVNANMDSIDYATPLPEEIFERATAGGADTFTSLDLRAGFWQLVPKQHCREQLRVWNGRRLMEYQRLPFGIKVATALFQQRMDRVLSGDTLKAADGTLVKLPWNCSKFASAYVDDVLIHSKSGDHSECVRKVMDNLLAAGFKIHPAKSLFGACYIEFLGHVLSPDGLQPAEAKVAAIQALPTPQNVKQLQSVMGLINYYRCYIPRMSVIANCINRLTQKGAIWRWGAEHEAAYQRLKDTLATYPVLRKPDPTRQFIVHTDWSCHGIAAVLAQQDDEGNEYMVACISRSLNEHEKRYTPWKGEMLAVVWGMKSFRHYTVGRKQPTLLVTDHRPLLGLLSTAEHNSQQARWLLTMAEFDYTIRHRPGTQHIPPDVLSRMPQSTTEDYTGVRTDEGPIIPPRLPEVQLGEQQLTGEQALQQLGPNFAEHFQQGWNRTTGPNSSSEGAAACLAQHALQTTLPWPAAHNALSGGVLNSTQPGSVEAITPSVLCFLAGDDGEVELQSAAAGDNWAMHCAANAWVQAAIEQDSVHSCNAPGAGGVDTSSCATTFFPWALQHGVTLFEPFGGLGAGLEMTLRMGISVNRYLYADTSPVARTVMEHRLCMLSTKYPEQLSPAAWEQTFQGEQDVYKMTQDYTESLVKPEEQWLLVAGWECQDLSAAGSNKGLQGQHSKTYYPVVSMLQQLQQANAAQGNPPLAYLLENTAFQFNWKSATISKEHFAEVCWTMGQAVAVDAAQFGSGAHRLRNFWTNLAEPSKLAAALQAASRAPNQPVREILDPGRHPMPVQHPDRYPWYTANVMGEPRQVMPTLMAFPLSYNFRPGKPGSVWDNTTQRFDEPNANERERMLGYDPGSTAAAGVSEAQRRAVLGRCIDANTAQSILSAAGAWWSAEQQQLHMGDTANNIIAVDSADTTLPALVCIAEAWWAQNCSVSAWEDVPQKQQLQVQQHQQGIAYCLAATAAAADEDVIALAAEELAMDTLQLCQDDPHNDTHLLHLLQTGGLPQGLDRKERDRLGHLAKRFSYHHGVLRRITATGRQLIVPKLEERLELIAATHEQGGHFGVKRTVHLLQSMYWWSGMYKDVQQVVSRCSQCDRARVSFAGLNPKLTSLPIQGLFYRWHVDCTMHMPKSQRGNTGICVMVDAFSKVLEVSAIPTKEPQYVADAFANKVLARYTAPAVVCTDQGTEYGGEFAALLLQYQVTHSTTAPGHPQSNGMAERCIQAVKRALKKAVECDGDVQHWEKHLPNIQMAYNASVQESTRYSPYQLCFGVPPVPPASRRERLMQPINFDNKDQAAKELAERAMIMQRDCTMAANNLRIAQERDQLNYARRRDGTYLPAVKQFEVGDYVYTRTAPASMNGTGLTLGVEPVILRVAQVNADGTLELVGKDGGRKIFNATNATRCHHPDIDGTIDWTLIQPSQDHACVECGSASHARNMLLCDGCNAGYHLWCLDPPLTAIPDGYFICPKCAAAGLTEQQIDLRQQQTVEQQQRRLAYQEFKRVANPSALQKRKDAENAKLHNALVKKKTTQGDVWGRISYRGPGVKDPFLVTYQDGSNEECNRHHVSKRNEWLQPPDEQLPAGVTIPQPQESSLLSALSPAKQVASAAAWQQLVQQAMPGHWPAAALQQGWEECQQYQAGRTYYPISSQSVQAVWQQLDWPKRWSTWDPYAANSNVCATLNLTGATIRSLAVDQNGPATSNALLPAAYAHKKIDAIITAPPPKLLAVALPRILEAASKAVCVAVPPEWVQQLQQTEPGRNWFHHLQRFSDWCVVAHTEQGTHWLVLGVCEGWFFRFIQRIRSAQAAAPQATASQH